MEYAGAIYHVMSRGDRQEGDIFGWQGSGAVFEGAWGGMRKGWAADARYCD